MNVRNPTIMNIPPKNSVKANRNAKRPGSGNFKELIKFVVLFRFFSFWYPWAIKIVPKTRRRSRRESD